MKNEDEVNESQKSQINNKNKKNLNCTSGGFSFLNLKN